MSIRNALHKAAKLICVTAVLGASFTAAHAGLVTLPIGLQAIYDQANIEIRYNATQTIYNSSLLTIDEANQDALAAYQVGGNTISAFFVDQINFCGAAVPGIVGCAGVPGTYLFLDAGFMASASEAPTAMGHELGHNLGLDHVDRVDPAFGDNLMNPETYFDGTPAPLTADQIAQIFLNPLNMIQFDGNQAFISITPFAVLASAAVPEPETLALVCLGLGATAFMRRRRAGAARQAA
jgi:hypothetical protein